MKRRIPWLAFLLSLVCPGMGQLYNGNHRWALAGLLASATLSTVTALWLFGSLALLLQALVMGLALDLFLATHAYFQAKSLGVVPLKPYQRWWIYVGFAILVYGLPDGYGTLMPQRFLSFQIPSESMLPNLLVGDRLVADGWAFWGKDPQRGDIVVFDYPKDPKIKYVKRVIGLPGDDVEMRMGDLYVNSVLVRQRRTSDPASDSKSGWQQVAFVEKQGDKEYRIQRMQPQLNSDFGPEKVPDNHFFVLGDNRDRSNDSRVWGYVPREAIVGRMAYVYFSWDSEAGALRKERLGLQVR